MLSAVGNEQLCESHFKVHDKLLFNTVHRLGCKFARAQVHQVIFGASMRVLGLFSS